MFDYHIHSHFSPDAIMTMEAGIKAAITKGLSEICFTDHIDYDFDGNNHHIIFDYDDYFKAIKNYKDKYKNEIEIKIGVELGLQSHSLDKYNEDIQNHSFDFVIGSVHSVEKTDLYSGSFFNKKTQLEAYSKYFEELYLIITQFEEFNVIGHLDVIKRYGSYDIPLPLESYSEITRSILLRIIEKGKGIELNTSGIRYQVGDYHPSLDVFKLYHQLGGEIITIGSDAHRTDQLGFDLKNALKALDIIGFKYICTFDTMQPRFHKIISLI
ncbi:histidinol-phosphatase HisJ family protein [Alkaliphilus peptidifermentans]|uniref:Histidinol-phosphatase n=1 Tax=Alkaliphilus peptidifermentans DSM 18978 TaxID=1120976 RepID=A0A1G5CPF4_9FIRM|nr:histidinol-phosphatase HisJ family protein [Alkaliphilus peptidifermentans]SCY04130.1 histidinol-phosphatase (PHP family) [Alkaliphilus peptidifermentans DSM 18978]